MEWLHIYGHEQHRMRDLHNALKALTKGDSHTVMVLRRGSMALPRYAEGFDTDAAGMKELFARMKKADRIVWHGFPWGRKFVLQLWLHRGLLKKSVWHIAPGDVVEDNYNGCNPAKLVYHRIKAQVKSSMLAYAADNWDDYYSAKNAAGMNAKVFLTGSDFDRDVAKALKNMPWTEKTGKPVRVLIGSGNDPSLKHKKVLEILSRFMYEDIEIHIPLYGPAVNREYAGEVRAYARKIFGHKAVFHSRELSAEEHVRLLRDTDVGIFFSGAMNGYRDMLALRYLGRKVYCADAIRKDYRLEEIEKRLGRIADMGKGDLGRFASYTQNIDAKTARARGLKSKFMVIFPKVNRPKVLRRIQEFDQSAGWTELVRFVKDPTAQAADRSVRYLHVIPPRHNIIYPFMEMCQKCFPAGEHQFLVTTHRRSFAPGLVPQPYTEFEMGGNTRERLRHVFTRLRAAEHIVFHSLYISKWEALFLAFSPALLKKSAWIEWGKDLYDYKLPVKKPIHLLHNYLHRRIREKIPCYVSIFPPDAEKFREQFSNDTPILQTNYTAYNSVEMVERVRPAPRKGGPLRIQVGHSCNSWGNHLQVLDALSHLKFNNIQLQIPLSTGAPPINKKTISEYATTLFGHKAEFLWDEMDKENYFRFLWSVDVAVFGLYRQAGLGNIIRLLYMGKKVFLPKESVMYKFFAENGVEIYDTDTIADMSYEEFAAPLKTPAPHPFIAKMMQEQDLVNTWEQVFVQLEEITGSRN